MREIKFRAYVRKETFDDLGVNMHLAGVDQHEELIQVRDISFDEGKVDYVTDKDGNEYSFCNGNLISVIQYTGLEDSHRNEIYEGDIIETLDTNNNICRSIVKFHQGVFCVGAWSERPPKSVEHYNYDGDWRGRGVEIEDDEILYIVLQHSLNFKVVGNIHEHPHLLEKSE